MRKRFKEGDRVVLTDRPGTVWQVFKAVSVNEASRSDPGAQFLYLVEVDGPDGGWYLDRDVYAIPEEKKKEKEEDARPFFDLGDRVMTRQRPGVFQVAEFEWLGVPHENKPGTDQVIYVIAVDDATTGGWFMARDFYPAPDLEPESEEPEQEEEERPRPFTIDDRVVARLPRLQIGECRVEDIEWIGATLEQVIYVVAEDSDSGDWFMAQDFRLADDA